MKTTYVANVSSDASEVDVQSIADRPDWPCDACGLKSHRTESGAWSCAAKCLLRKRKVIVDQIKSARAESRRTRL